MHKIAKEELGDSKNLKMDNGFVKEKKRILDEEKSISLEEVD